MSFRMRLNTQNPNRKIAKQPVQSVQSVEQHRPKTGPNGRPIINNRTNEYFTGRPQVEVVIPGGSANEVVIPGNTKLVFKDEFTVGEDTVVYDESSGLWKIK